MKAKHKHLWNIGETFRICRTCHKVSIPGKLLPTRGAFGQSGNYEFHRDMKVRRKSEEKK